MKKKFFVLGLFFLLVLSSFVFGEIEELSHSIRVVSNTDECLINCETVYEVCAISKDVSVSFKFNKKTESFIQDSNNKGFYSKEKDEEKGSPLIKNAVFKNYEVKGNKGNLVSKGTCENITITAKKIPNEIIDNIPVIDGIEHTEFIYWNMSWQIKQLLETTGTMIGNNRVARFQINNLSTLHCGLINCSDIRIVWENTTTAIERNYFFFNSSGTKGVLYLNISNITGGNYYLYNNNSLAHHVGNGSKVFYFFDDARDNVGIPGNKWTISETGGGTITDDGSYYIM